MSQEAVQTGYWIVEDDGTMKYMDEEKVKYEVPAGALIHKDRIALIRSIPTLDHYDFFLNWYKACEKAQIKEVTIRI